MELKQLIFLGMTVTFIPVAVWFGIRYRWAERMLVAGEDARYIARRLLRFASEDVGLADPMAVSPAKGTSPVNSS